MSRRASSPRTEPATSRPPTWPHDWIGANLDEASAPDWTEIAGFLEQAWRMSAAKRAIAEHDRS
ncbi:hypothetical protein SAMN02982929_03186 [Saccharopolyspora kobensis]|uniref:Uncharacterized protein n=1 Tax=Saccharopolyspora kobensis TaxID=146035 RepID=A0A1H6C754_9PSEU|nr:hypothetical protein [Saccharopolyspora kobensis]SEG68799.1 hypothetical protein SAMN02982929_03186 [Saccharopolyspora kobensis]SFC30970.1 hypothetical protein SAMN05216506_101427 [Saccharopolyspora kobensis]